MRDLLVKLTSYLLYLASAVVFFYFSISIGLSFFHEGAFPLLEEAMMEKVLLPMLYAGLSFIVMVVSQFILIGKPDSLTETKLYLWANFVVFLFHLAIIAIVLIVAGVAIKDTHPDYAFILVPCVLPLLVAVAEIAFSSGGLFLLYKAIREEEKAEVTENVAKTDEKEVDSD